MRSFPVDTYQEVAPLSEVTDEMRDNLRSLSQTVYDKIQKCRNQEKSTWKRLADLEEHVETIYTRIDKIADELVSLIVFSYALMKVKKV